MRWWARSPTFFSVSREAYRKEGKQMRIGVPKEIKTHEYRVGLTPGSVRELVQRGHEVVIEAGAGDGIGASDRVYEQAGASILLTADDVFATADMIVKVKEPLAPERARLREGQILFTYLHLAADKLLTTELIESGAICIAYETVTGAGGILPLLLPMSEIAGRMSIQAAASCLEKSRNGMGVLLGGAVGVEPANVLILGGGIVGSNAASMALGLGASVTVIDSSMPVLRGLNARFGHALRTVFSTRDSVVRLIREADVVIGGVLLRGAAAPRLISAADVKAMKPGSVLVDVAIDQGGCAETSQPTTHADPTYVVDDVVHYCVANMPGAVARTSAYALNNATLPFTVELAEHGAEEAMRRNPHLRQGLNIYQGKLTQPEVARGLRVDFTEMDALLGEAA
jgi:alanine dehydrogenase